MRLICHLAIVALAVCAAEGHAEEQPRVVVTSFVTNEIPTYQGVESGDVKKGPPLSKSDVALPQIVVTKLRDYYQLETRTSTRIWVMKWSVIETSGVAPESTKLPGPCSKHETPASNQKPCNNGQ